MITDCHDMQSVMMLTRLSHLLSSPICMLFSMLGAIPMALGTIVQGLALIVGRNTWAEWAITLALVLWWIQASPAHAAWSTDLCALYSQKQLMSNVDTALAAMQASGG